MAPPADEPQSYDLILHHPRLGSTESETRDCTADSLRVRNVEIGCFEVLTAGLMWQWLQSQPCATTERMKSTLRSDSRQP